MVPVVPVVMRRGEGARDGPPTGGPHPRWSSAIHVVGPPPEPDGVPVADLHVVLARLQGVYAPERVGQGCAQAGDLVVLVVDAALEVGDAIAERLVLVLDHVVCKGAKGRDKKLVYRQLNCQRCINCFLQKALPPRKKKLRKKCPRV